MTAVCRMDEEFVILTTRPEYFHARHAWGRSRPCAGSGHLLLAGGKVEPALFGRLQVVPCPGQPSGARGEGFW